MKFAMIGTLLLSQPFAHAATTPPETKPKETETCTTTREFVTALEFLRADENFRLKESEARDLAFKVAEGCTGAAKRFIRVAKTLVSSGSTRKNATETGLKFASTSDAATDAFTTVFQQTIAEDSLDLDFEASLRIALSLSKEFSGDLKKVREDFVKVVDFCSDTETVGLARSQCGPFAANVAKAGEKWNSGIAQPFIQSFEYLRSNSGPALVTGDALKVAEALITKGPGAPDNFKQAYQYASSNSGLGLTREDAIRFAKKMASIGNMDVKSLMPKEDQEKKNSD